MIKADSTTQDSRIAQYLATHDKRKLQIGCGTNIKEDWLNTDIAPKEGAVYLDATRPLPFDDDTFEYIFSEHLIEHIPFKDGMRLLNDSFRVTRPGGKIRIATPDLECLAELYAADRAEVANAYIIWQNGRVHKDLDDKTLVAPVANTFVSDWGHKFIYDFRTLDYNLREAGYTDVTLCKVGESNDPNLSQLEVHGRIIPPEYNELTTVVVEATKSTDTITSTHKIHEARQQYLESMKIATKGSGEKKENLRAIELLKQAQPYLNVDNELRMFERLEHAKYLAYQAEKSQGTDSVLYLAKSVEVLRDILRTDPTFRGAQLTLREYTSKLTEKIT